MKILIKNGRIVTAVDDYRADILIEGDNRERVEARKQQFITAAYKVQYFGQFFDS